MMLRSVSAAAWRLAFGAAALAACADPEATSRAPPPGRAAADSLLAAGEALYLDGGFDSAVTRWERALDWSRAEGDAEVEGRALTWLGLAAYRTGEHAAARRIGEQALAVKRRAGLARELSRSYNALGLLAWNEGRLFDAQALFDTASATARAAGDDEGEAKAAGNLGLVLIELGEFEHGRAGFETMLAAGRRLGEHRLQGNALNNLGMLDVRLGDAPAALARLREARRHYQAIGYGVGEQNALGQLATAHAALGDYSGAFASLDSALVICRELELRQDEATTLEVMADLHRRAGDLRHALRLYEQAAPIDAELGLEVERGANARARAELQLDLGRPDLARRLADEALRAHRSAGARWEELQDLLVLAQLSARGGDARSAARQIAAADTLAALMQARTARSQVALTRARIADRAEDAAAALHAVSDSLDAGLEALGYDALAEAHSLRARAYARAGNLEAAAARGWRAVRAVERVRAGIGSGQLRSAHAAVHAEIYSDLVASLVKLGRIEEAFTAADAARGQTLLEHLAIEADRRPAGSLGRLARRERSLREIHELNLRVAELDRIPPRERDTATAALSRHLTARLAEARRSYQASLATGGERDGRLPLIGAGSATAREVRAALGEDEVLLEYLLAPDRVHLFVVAPAGVEHLALPLGAEELQRRVRLAHELLSASETGAAPEPVLSSLHADLVASALETRSAAGARRLIVVPHGALERVPFAALRDARSGRWLVEDFSVLHLGSAAALVALRQSGGTGGPASGPAGSAPQLAIFAPHPDRLPGTRLEAIAVRGAWPGAEAHMGPAAHEGRVVRALAEGGMVHVATHGRLEPRSPMFSHLELRPGGVASDGRLEVHELFGVPVRAPLVFLSGCETATEGSWGSPFVTGAEYATLAHALLYGGARNVVGTRWIVEDTAAARLAARFYLHLRRVAPPEALAAAQRDLLGDPRTASPRVWAAHQVSGDGFPVAPRPHTGAAVSVYQ